MKRKTPYQTFFVHAGTYEYEVNVIFTKDLTKLRKYILYKMKSLPPDMEKFEIAKGMVVRMDGYCPILWLPRPPKTPDELAVLNHEIFHLTYTIMSYVGIPLTGSSEEAFAHLISHLTRQILEKMK